MTGTIEHTSGCTSFVGRPAVEVFRAKAIASACDLYAKTGMQVNRAYTPTNMLKAAASITGKTYKRGQHKQAAADLREWANEQIGTTVEVVS
jgi:hypothetical protein